MSDQRRLGPKDSDEGRLASSVDLSPRHLDRALVTGSLLRAAALVSSSPLPQGHECNRGRNKIGDMLAAQVVPYEVV